jgi:hypothetical protein
MSAKNATARLLKGRKIVDVELRRFEGEPGRRSTDPILTLDNGARLSFVVRETGAEYGVEIIYHAPPDPKDPTP